MLRWLFLGIIAIVSITVLGGGLGLWWLSGSLPPQNATVSAGTQAPVSVAISPDGVPTVQAESLADAVTALGYLHAQDRLWQMESMRRLGAGRLSEILGDATLRTDQWMRTLGLYRLAEAQFDRLAPQTRELLEAYAKGVNAFLSGHDGPLPPEFIALGHHRPEPWRPADSLVWAKIMGMQLSGDWRDELHRADVLEKLGPEALPILWPPYPGDAPITTVGRPWQGLDLAGPAGLYPLPTGSPKGASNAWAVAGGRTDTGKPILASDPHLGFSAPILWYLARIEIKDRTLAGATVPGVPFLIIGHNGHVAWGITTTQSDLQDLFVEELIPGAAGRYLTEEGPQPLKVRHEIVRVKSQADRTITIRESRNGPLISDLGGYASRNAGERRALALRATYLMAEDLTPDTFPQLMAATTVDEAEEALHRFHAPQQNFMLADKDDIRFLAAGRIPIRRSGAGRLPQAGPTSAGAWSGWVPFDALPRSRNPEGGYLFNANNKVTKPGDGLDFGDGWAAPYRARRLEQLLTTCAPCGLDEHQSMQLDVISLAALELVPLMTRFEGRNDRQHDVLQRLRAWDGGMQADRAEPFLFMAFLHETLRAVFADELGELFDLGVGQRIQSLKRVLSDPAAVGWCDDRNTPGIEDCAATLLHALDAALDRWAEVHGEDPEDWRWRDVHQARFDHAVFGRLPLIHRAVNLSTPTGGGDYTVGRGAMRTTDTTTPFAHRHGAGFRAVFDLENLDRSRFMIATGQSGNPLSAQYRNLLDRWQRGAALILDGRGPVAGRLTLTP